MICTTVDVVEERAYDYTWDDCLAEVVHPQAMEESVFAEGSGESVAQGRVDQVGDLIDVEVTLSRNI